MQMLYCFINNVHVDYAALIWEGIRILKWMLAEEMKLTKHYQFAPRTPNPVEHQGESSDPRKPTIIRIQRRSQPNSKTLIPTAAKIDITSLDEATKMSIATEQSLAYLEARQNVKRVEEHLVDTEIEQIVEGNHDVDENQSVDEILNSQEDPDTSNEEEEEESTRDALIRMKGKGIEELQELMASDPTASSSKSTTSSPKPKSYRVKQYKSVFHKMSRRYGYTFRHLKQSFMPMKDFKAITEVVYATLKKVVPSIVDKTLNDIIEKNIPKIVADRIRSERQKVQNDLATLVVDAIKKEQGSIRVKLFVEVTHDMKDDKRARDVDLAIWLSLKIKFEKLVPLVKPYRVDVVYTQDHEDHHDDNARPEGASDAVFLDHNC
nr:hypothetical protein [Tanacetum cinerariifolium]